MHTGDYLKQSCNLAYEWSDADSCKWNKNRKVALIGIYWPEIDILYELGDEIATRFQQIIGILRW